MLVKTFLYVGEIINIKEEGLVNFFCHDRHPKTDFSGCIYGDKNDGEIKNIGFISFFALELDFVNPARVLAKSTSEKIFSLLNLGSIKTTVLRFLRLFGAKNVFQCKDRHR